MNNQSFFSFNTNEPDPLVLPYASFYSFVHNFAKLSKYKIEIEVNFASDGNEAKLHASVTIMFYKNWHKPEEVSSFIINYMRRNKNFYECVSPHIDKCVAENLISQFIKIYPEYREYIEKENFKYSSKRKLSNKIINIVKNVKWESGKCDLNVPFIASNMS